MWKRFHSRRYVSIILFGKLFLESNFSLIDSQIRFCGAWITPADIDGNVACRHNVRAQPEAYEGMKAGALPTLGINGRFMVYGAGLEPMPALVNSTFDRAGAANVNFPPKVSNTAFRFNDRDGLKVPVRCGIHQ
jgi:hypothetical protein